jgi:hypothetical protein
MDPISVPRPKSVRNPNRAASSLLLAQVKHLREAEKNLPPKYQSGIFIHAIQTEGEAADYISAATKAIHRAHDNAAAQRIRKARQRGDVIEIAAVADEAAERRRTSPTGKKQKKKKTGKS